MPVDGEETDKSLLGTSRCLRGQNGFIERSNHMRMLQQQA